MDGLILLVGVIYLLPAAVAQVRRHHQTTAIVGLNILLGWTVLGWVAAPVWALTATLGESAVPPQSPPLPTARQDAPWWKKAMVLTILVGGVAVLLLVESRGRNTPPSRPTSADADANASPQPKRTVIQQTPSLVVYAYETADGDTVREWENARGEIVARRLSRPAPAACNYLRALGLEPGEYGHEDGFPPFFCGTPYQTFGKGTDPHGLGPKNALAYYVSGDRERVHDMKLVLNVHQRHEAKQAHAAFLRAAQVLTQKALSVPLPKGAEQAMLTGKSWRGQVSGAALDLTRTNWRTGKGYDLTYVVRPKGETP